MCPNTCFSRTTCSLSRYNVKGELDCFNCGTGFFLRLFTLTFTKESNYNPRFCEKKSTRLFLSNNTIMHQFSKTFVNSKVYPSELLLV